MAQISSHGLSHKKYPTVDANSGQIFYWIGGYHDILLFQMNLDTSFAVDYISLKICHMIINDRLHINRNLLLKETYKFVKKVSMKIDYEVKKKTSQEMERIS
jgi:hypothetical protein